MTDIPPPANEPHDAFYIQIECRECGWDWDGWHTHEAERAMREHTNSTRYPSITDEP